MSKSRLEKFLYALYSLDSSDLPTPLSRIEELYKCWVTGDEVPTFKPLSRVEKYLMAILGGYDVNELPNPISRVEVLLHKLTIGDDNLDDIKSFLSEHEELLAEIIRNGGAGGNIDIEYVLYTLSTEHNTLYNTAEKPVKSAILKGNTLVNLFDGEKMALNESLHYTYSNGIIKSAVDGQPWSSKTNIGSAIKPKTKYLLKVKNVGEYDLSVQMRFVLSTLYLSQPVSVGQEVIKIIETGEEIDGLYIKIYPQKVGDGIYAQAKLNIIEYQDGIENWDIPYFEGMQSVKMPVLRTSGKNLFNINIFKNESDEYEFPYEKWKMQLKPNTTYIANSSFTRPNNDKTNYDSYGAILNGSKQIEQLYLYHWNLNLSFVNKIFTTDDTGVIYLGAYKGDCPYNVWDMVEMQIEEGSTATSYEPYKSNILTVNEDITLRSNGDVCDELNLLTGRLTQRIDENNEVLAQAVVKTVDLSVVDQDGNITKLSTFNDITHVTLSSEGLIPEAELEVATKNKEVLNTMSLEMEDISTTQTALEETSNTQSENVDATMMATTEIYEELL